MIRIDPPSCRLQLNNPDPAVFHWMLQFDMGLKRMQNHSACREAICEQKDVRYMMPENVFLAIEEKKFYRR